LAEDKIVEAPMRSDLMPLLDPAAAKRAYHAYLELCQAILVPYDSRKVDKRGVVIQESDYSRITQKKKDEKGNWITEYVDAPSKSAWRKLSKFYGLSDEIVEKSKEIHANGSFTYHYTVKAIGPNGVYTTGEGSCTSTEKGGKSEHDTRATAHTRAKSRAISDLIGFGQVSAEEYGNYEDEKPAPRYEPADQSVDDGSGVFDLPTLNSFLLNNSIPLEWKGEAITEDSDGILIVRSPKGGNIYELADTLLRGINFEWIKGGGRWERTA